MHLFGFPLNLGRACLPRTLFQKFLENVLKVGRRCWEGHIVHAVVAGGGDKIPVRTLYSSGTL